MNEDEFDDLVREAAPMPSTAATSTAVLLGREAGIEAAGVVPLRPRPGWQRAAGVAAAALLLTGAGTVTAYQLSVPPFNTLERGVERVTTPIEVNYMNSLGREVECLAFIEYQNLGHDERAAVEDIAADERWDGYGQRVLDNLRIPNASPEAQNEAIVEVLRDDLWEATEEAVPGIVRMQDSNGPVFNGFSLSCAGPGGVDGRP